MASKALFAGLHVDLFTRLSEGPRTAEALAGDLSVPPNRLRILLNALLAIGLVSVEDDRFSNAPASEMFLSRTSRYDFGDYLRHQIDGQMYGRLEQLNNAMDGNLDEDAIASYAHWMSDPEAAALYSESQHAGSLGPGRSLARQVDLSGARSLLDIGGGTGAMTIRLCEANPELHSTIIDFPNVAEIGWRFITEAELIDRVRYIPGDALSAAWPGEQDVILMSYLFSGVPGDSIPQLVRRAHECLVPGGTLLVHDFMVNQDGSGPELAALWQLQHMAFTPDARSVSPGWLRAQMNDTGFDDITVCELIPGMTRLVQARKPLRESAGGSRDGAC
ncbi:MAG: methyltransferase [Gammaproteobacteria bacterium]|nr:methyltransferase [Gammaproteobacteria bacterium]